MSYVDKNTTLIMEKPQLKMIPCTKCDGTMPELRLTEYGYNFCIKCSESGNYVKPKQGINVLMGEGDHTWVETIIMSAETYDQYLSDTGQLVTSDVDPLIEIKNSSEILDFDEEDNNTPILKKDNSSLLD
jgi:hypothetical protein|tara:strand:+ start:58 stop:447 length:390 start_codon:yes stop_codon:yes gene_type:complete